MLSQYFTNYKNNNNYETIYYFIKNTVFNFPDGDFQFLQNNHYPELLYIYLYKHDTTNQMELVAYTPIPRYSVVFHDVVICVNIL